MIAEIRAYKGMQYLYADYRGARTNEEMFAILDKGVKLLKENPDITRIFGNFKDSYMSSEFTQRIKNMGKTEGYKTALIGISGLKRFFINVIQAVAKYETCLFNDEAEALEWLVT